MEKVPQAGYAIKGLWISGLQRRLTLKNLSFPFKVIHSLWKASRILKQFKPDMVIGTGGYASGPVMKMAGVKHIKYVIQEQNSYPGITNKLLAKKAEKICVAYDGLAQFFPEEKIIKTGNPVRQDLLEINTKRKEAQQLFRLKKDKTTLLVIGGSLGARRINQLIEKELVFFKQHQIQLLWQCGKLYYEAYKKYQEDTIHIHPFLDRMDLAYAAADIIISRAGAGTVSELCIVGKPVIFIPSPNVAEDHQTRNAKAIVAEKAAILIREKELDESFENVFLSLLSSEEEQKNLSRTIKKLALPEAAAHIVDEIVKILKE